MFQVLAFVLFMSIPTILLLVVVAQVLGAMSAVYA